MTTFHEPVLAKHLADINFIPELYAIPWFLTMFSHVFPLHKIIHLWDKLILGDNSYPLFIGISILKHLKSTLLSSGFNECILLFSDLPDIVMEYCVIESQKMYAATPKSVAYRKYVKRDHDFQATGPLDITNLHFKMIENETSPRISANDLVELLRIPEKLATIDLRSTQEFSRIHVAGSINIPFAGILLGDPRLDSLGVSCLENQLKGKIIVIISQIHDNAVLVSVIMVVPNSFEFLLICCSYK